MHGDNLQSEPFSRDAPAERESERETISRVSGRQNEHGARRLVSVHRGDSEGYFFFLSRASAICSKYSLMIRA
jgi:hypothetical protein